MTSPSVSTPPLELTARVAGNGVAVLETREGHRTFRGATTKAATSSLISYVADDLARTGDPVRVTTYDAADRAVVLLVHSDHTIERVATAPSEVPVPDESTAPTPVIHRPTPSASTIAEPATEPERTPEPPRDARKLRDEVQPQPNSAADAATAHDPQLIGEPNQQTVGADRLLATPVSATRPAIHNPRPQAPKMGIQGLIYRLTKVNFGLSERERKHNQLVARIRTPLPTLHRTAFISLKGGIGKTTSAAGFGHTFAHYRADPVFVIDANPDAGTLAKRTIGEPLAGVKPLLEAIKADKINSLTDLSRFTRTAGRLTVLPGDPDPQAGEAMDANDFRTVMQVIERYYSLILIDTGDGVTRPITPGILEAADSVVVAATHSLDGAEAAIETLNWLSTHGYSHLAGPAVVTLSAKDNVSKEIDRAAVAQLLRDRAGALVTIPPDSHLADAGAIDRDRLAAATRRVLMEGAAAVAGHWADIDQQPPLTS